MFRHTPVRFSINEIKRIYPNQWVAVLVAETDADGFAASGQVIVHDREEQFVWAAVKLGESDEPIYVFYTGSRRADRAVA
jgi:hypothetical protein